MSLLRRSLTRRHDWPSSAAPAFRTALLPCPCRCVPRGFRPSWPGYWPSRRTVWCSRRRRAGWRRCRGRGERSSRSRRSCLRIRVFDHAVRTDRIGQRHHVPVGRRLQRKSNPFFRERLPREPPSSGVAMALWASAAAGFVMIKRLRPGAFIRFRNSCRSSSTAAIVELRRRRLRRPRQRRKKARRIMRRASRTPAHTAAKLGNDRAHHGCSIDRSREPELPVARFGKIEGRRVDCVTAADGAASARRRRSRRSSSAPPRSTVRAPIPPRRAV